MLHDSRVNRAWDHRALAPLEMLVYDFCDAPREFADITRAAAEHDPDVNDGRVRAILDGFVADRTMVTEAHSYLSLALHDDEFFPWPTHGKRAGSTVEQA